MRNNRSIVVAIGLLMGGGILGLSYAHEYVTYAGYLRATGYLYGRIAVIGFFFMFVGAVVLYRTVRYSNVSTVHTGKSRIRLRLAPVCLAMSFIFAYAFFSSRQYDSQGSTWFAILAVVVFVTFLVEVFIVLSIRKKHK